MEQLRLLEAVHGYVEAVEAVGRYWVVWPRVEYKLHYECLL